MQVAEFFQDDATATLCTLTGRNHSPNEEQLTHLGCTEATERHSTCSSPAPQTHSLVHRTHSVLCQHLRHGGSPGRPSCQARNDENPKQNLIPRFENQAIPSRTAERSIHDGGERNSSSRPTESLCTIRTNTSPAVHAPHGDMHRGLPLEGALAATHSITKLMHDSVPQMHYLSSHTGMARQSAVGVPVTEGRQPSQMSVSFDGPSPKGGRKLGTQCFSSSHYPVDGMTACSSVCVHCLPECRS